MSFLRLRARRPLVRNYQKHAMRLCPALQVLCAGLVVWIGGVLPVSSATRNVFLLYDERLDLPGLAALDADLVGTLTSDSADRIDVYREEMDLSRYGSDDSYKVLLRDFLRAKYAGKKIDVAVSILGPALEFLLDHGDAIFPGTPIVFCGIDRKEFGDRSLPPHVRGVLVKREFAPTLQLALRLHPQTKRVVVVAGTSDFDTRLLDQAKQEFRIYEDRLAFTYLTGPPLQQLLVELSQLTPQTIVLFTTFFQDGAGQPFVPHNVMQRVSAAASVPVYGFTDQYLGRGILGGSLYSFSAQGAEAAKLVLQLLADPKHSQPSLLEPTTNKVLFDWRQMQRWGISESSLPVGSEIRFHDLTVWEQYRAQIVVLFTVLLVQAALISWLVYEYRRRNRAEVLARNSMSELTHMNRVATAGELSASIAHEVNQPLTGIVARVGAARRWLAAEKPDLNKVRAALDQIETAGLRASDIITNVKSMFQRDTQDRSAIDVNKLIWTVMDLVYIDLRKHQIELKTELSDQLPPVLGNRVQLQQVILNLVMNAIDAMRSVQPRVLSIKTALNGRDGVHISIADTGIGIDPSNLDQIFKPLFTTKEHGMGMGLSICRSIVESHNGRIWLSAGPERGSIFQLALPTNGRET